MSTFVNNDVASGNVIYAADHNEQGARLAAVLNGNIDAGNIADSAIGSSKIADGAITEAKLTHRPSEYIFDHIASGCVWSGDSYGSTRNASCTSGVVYIAGKRLTVAAVTARSFTASKDVYCDLKDNGDSTAVWVYYDNTTNAVSPSFATTGGTVRGAIVVVGASSIANAAAINQGQEDRVLPIASSVPYAVTDSLGNLICPRDPNRRVLGYRQITGNFAVSSASATQITGLSCPIITPTGRKVKVTVSVSSHYNSGANSTYISIWDGIVASGTQLQFTRNGVGGNPIPACAEATVTPGSANKTYNAGLHGSAGTGTIEASTTQPAFIKVELM